MSDSLQGTAIGFLFPEKCSFVVWFGYCLRFFWGEVRKGVVSFCSVFYKRLCPVKQWLAPQTMGANCTHSYDALSQVEEAVTLLSLQPEWAE